ncbi:MAG: PD40 domain-containing protein [Candidatus Krumholzibacteriota bacterium]|nr:PD40 domain-containing protein [Candidatus Krumholzibacteriota bacterium]
MFRRFLFAAIALAAVSTLVACDAAASPGGNPLRLMRRPDIADDGRIVFVYQGDLWLVPPEGGVARRLTVHMGTEDYPKFSPDGTMIAFSGDHNERRNQLNVMPAGGGMPTQLTFESAGGRPVMWTRDGSRIVFSSTRESFIRFFKQFFSVPAGGGMPVDLGLGKASFGSFSPDGTKIALNRHSDRFWWWKRYKGSANTDVWVYDIASKSFDKLTDWEGNDSWPMWTGTRIYFVSDRDGGVSNLFFIDTESGETTQVTHYDAHGITWPSMSADGSRIVFERDHRLWTLDTASGAAREVVVYAESDFRENIVSWVNPLEHLSSFEISPTGKRIAFEARGEIYTAPAEHGDVRNLTESSGSRDRNPAWSPDGKWIAYVSDRTGDDEVYLIDQMGREPEKKLTSSGHFKTGLQWSPESDRLLYGTEDNALYMLDIDGGSPVLINRNEHRDIQTYHWSPDGKWIAYDFARRNRARDIWFYNVKTGKHHQVTTHLADDTEPYFTPDGKYLLFITERMRGGRALVRTSLMPEEEEPFVFDDDEEAIDGADDDDANGDADDDAADDDGKKGRKNKKDKKKEKVEVKIDFTGLEDRIRRIPKTGGRGLQNVQATERYYYYQIMGATRMLFRVSYDLYMFDLEKLKSKKVASSIVSYDLSADNTKLAYWDGSNFRIMKVGSKAPGKKAAADDDEENGALDIRKKTEMRLDRLAEWRQIFNEGWRVVKYHFYDPNTHGVDWDEIREYYTALLPHVSTRQELNELMTEMVGELNASHQGVGRGEMTGPPTASFGYLGAKLVLDEKSGLPRIEKIFKADNLSTRAVSPLDADYVEVKEGDYLLAVDGHVLEPGENPWTHFVGKTRNKITITTNDRPTLKGAIETKVDPINHDITLRYNDWVDGNTAWVDEKSDDRIGYMHLADMSTSGWVEFREKFEQYRYKDGIIIDVRYNGGGSIDSRIIDYLERQPYQVQQSRGESPIYRPDDVFTGKIVVLINEYSYSDAEVFPAAVKERGLGTVIGVPTLGFVIAVTPHYLIDGGYIRKTFIGIWKKSTGEQLESRGAIPDIHVENTPESEIAGRDLQLEKAVEFLMESIGNETADDAYDVKIDER